MKTHVVNPLKHHNETSKAFEIIETAKFADLNGVLKPKRKREIEIT